MWIDTLAVWASLGLILPLLFLSGSWLAFDSRIRLSPNMRGIYALALGMILVSGYLLVAGHLFSFNRAVVLLLIPTVFFLQRRHWSMFWTWFRTCFLGSEAVGRPGVFQIITLLGMALTAILLGVPETGNDALCYQLNVPKLFVGQHSFWPIPHDWNTFMPMGMNTLYAAGLLFNQVSIAKAFHWLTGVSLTRMIVLVLDEETKNREIAWLGGAIFFLTPAVFNQITTTYVDAATALFMFLSLYLWGRQEDEPGPFAVFLVGLLLGWAVSIKFVLLFFLAPFFFFLMLGSFRREKFKNFIALLAGVALTCAFWFLRNWFLTGNPVFPYAGNLFGIPRFSNLQNFLSIGIPKTFLNFLLLPFHLVLKLETFGRNHWLGPMYLFLTPFIIWAVLTFKKFQAVFLIVVSYVAIWFFLVQNTRYLIPVLPFLIWMGIEGLNSFDKRLVGKPWARKFMNGGFFFALVLMLGLGGYHYRYEIASLARGLSANDFLKKTERSYPVAAWIKTYLPAQAKILNIEEIRQFYFQQSMTREFFLSVDTDYDTRVPMALWPDHFASSGYTHILRAKQAASSLFAQSKRHAVWDEILGTSPQVRKIATIASENLRDDKYIYEIYEILEPQLRREMK